MVEGRPTLRRVMQERSLDTTDEGGGRLWRWVVLSGLLHATFIWGLFIIPHVPFRKTPSYPVYTVELVGGEKVGGATLGSVVAPPPEPKKEIKKAKTEPPSRAQAQKKEKAKSVESPSLMKEKVALQKSKGEVREQKQVQRGLPEQVREKLIQSALERVRDRAESEQKKQKGVEISPGSGEGEGAAALGEGGRGGGIVKGVDFLIYYNRMRYLIRERWTWVGKKGDLEVTVRFGIQENGEIIGLRILRASRDPSYDDSVIRAVKKASPLPSPPENYRKDFMDVELTFRPKDLGG